MMYLALDPGETVGWARFTEEEGYSSGEIAQPVLWGFLETYRLTRAQQVVPIGLVLVYEGFDRRSTATNLAPVECIGVIKEWQRQMAGVTLVEQSASQAKFFWKNEKLVALGLYRKGKPHASDAMRHLLYYLYFNTTGPHRSGLAALRQARTSVLP